ncbi:MBOAT family O-acyltransferase [Sphingomonas oryzagri]|jgi:alginate O-acetyltransferase complex protein AlgI|uniref:Probable alginate O-acetylase AlgI n=1 Tax=Sphingomonas oryzagri TaxID=3042314 RepID=A0ABT6N2B0_9SPHN|nr:MBOAT family O-acyltransferase [Sphingomonas oryzagri]MDH7639197.1 MBOAT family O-acyltransferase [Sphingomonas oryzagri]
MLFNSSTFLLGFLPIVFAGFCAFSFSRLKGFAGLWLTVTSLLFYAWWRPAGLPILMVSAVANYLVAGQLIRRRNQPLLIAAILANLAALAYYKYAGFLTVTANEALGSNLIVPHIVLPLAISFFTFQQIAYLVDASDGEVEEHSFSNYCLFLTFFPHLIAGPITHHREMLSQFRDPDRFRPRLDLFAIGTTLFLIGLFKKVIVADGFATTVRPIFATAAGQGVQTVEAWTGALSYTLQIYFDFSGYSDMAIGLGLMFGISLPINFDSPLKARNIIEYWARWHMTLTRFLTAYIYNPMVVALTRRRALKGRPMPKRGKTTVGAFATLVALPTMITLFISGVWHGAGWQFVIFGLLHGSYLVIANGWRAWKAHRGIPDRSNNPIFIAGSVLTTFLAVVVGLVFFRSPDVTTAMSLLGSMIGLHGTTLPLPAGHLPGVPALAHALGANIGSIELVDSKSIARIVLFLIVVWALPNSNQWLGNYPTALGFVARQTATARFAPILRWKPRPAFGVALGAMSMVTILYAVSAAPSEFIYFHF